MSEGPVAPPKFPRGGKKLALLLMSPHAKRIGGRAVDSPEAEDDAEAHFVPKVAEAAKIPGLDKKLGIPRNSGKGSPVVRSSAKTSSKKKAEDEAGHLRGMKEQQRKVDPKHHDVHAETEDTGKVSKGTFADSSMGSLAAAGNNSSTILAASSAGVEKPWRQINKVVA